MLLDFRPRRVFILLQAEDGSIALLLMSFEQTHQEIMELSSFYQPPFDRLKIR